MGHAAQKLDGEYCGTPMELEQANLAKYETPIAKQLGEPTRNHYLYGVDTQRMNNSTHFRTAYHRPWWYYLAPWNWFKPATVTTDHNN